VPSAGQYRHPVVMPAFRMVPEKLVHSAFSSHTRQAAGCSLRMSCSTSALTACTWAVCVRITMPSSAGVVHAVGKRFIPSTSTMHRRQPPNALRASWKHRVGM
jgi:hypothetical protein